MNALITPPLVIITKGTYLKRDLSGTTATRTDIDNPRSGYYLLDGPLAGFVVRPEHYDEAFETWQEAKAVPVDN